MKLRIACIGFCVGIITSVFAQNPTKNIVVDQFGYLPNAKKIAIIKNPLVGFDAGEVYIPGSSFALVNTTTGDTVFTSQPVSWKSGATNASSGDQVWHFDFSSVTDKGTYVVLDLENNRHSFEFEISPSVYNEVLKHAVRTFFYQRVGFPKEAQYAGEPWADDASHIGPLQDKNCRIFNDKDNPDTERDVSGGWYDAGDYNKYTSWTANYIVELSRAYLERPSAWTDDYNIPESGNGIPDLLDEIKWGVDHLLRLQIDDGSVISIVGEAHASPPSAADGQSLYGPPNTSATLNSAGALAISSKAFRAVGMTDYADTLIVHAEKAWDWAETNPNVLFNNNDPAYGSVGLGAGRMEVDDYGRAMAKLEAACFLFDVTGDTKYRTYFDNNYSTAHLMAWNFAYPYETVIQDALLHYTSLPDATGSVVSAIKNTYFNSMSNGENNTPAYKNEKDPYFAHLDSYTWGSNNIKARKGSMFYNLVDYDFSSSDSAESVDAAANYIHYIHGANPLNMIFLSNMYRFGGENCVNEFYHSWFTNNSSRWDRVGVSDYGPAPGFLTGGPNPQYDWDGCCPTGCGSDYNNGVCTSEDISPPKDQPDQKSYKDFNTSWPLNSWSVTENSCGYQVSYIRLLSKFVDTTYDCNGDLNGTAYIDACGTCVGGNTGIDPQIDPAACDDIRLSTFRYVKACGGYTSPSGTYVWDSTGVYTDTVLTPAGLQEIITIDLEVSQPKDTAIVIEACDRYTSPSGTYTWTESGMYEDVIINNLGCDSIIHITLEIKPVSDTTLNISACNSFTTSDGENTWTSSGTYNQTMSNYAGCDSVITYKLTVTKVNTNVTSTQGVLEVRVPDLEYQWLDCDDNYSEIAGATQQSFTPSQSGNYAARITQNGCVDTSNCFQVNVSGIVYNTMEGVPQLFPNPVHDELSIHLPKAYASTTITITDLTGRKVFETKVFHQQYSVIPFDSPAGIYLVQIRNQLNQTAIARVIKK